MKKSKELIKKILREGILENKLPNFEKYIIDNLESFQSEDSDDDLKARIYSRFLEKKKYFEEIDHKLKVPENLNFIGEYVNFLMIKNEIEYSDINKKIKIDYNTFTNFLKNKIDLTLINIETHVALARFFNISLTTAKILLKKSIKLYQINPNVSNAMARYSYKDGQNERTKSMKMGLDELLLKASDAKPFKSENESNIEINLNQFLIDFEKEYINDSSSR